MLSRDIRDTRSIFSQNGYLVKRVWQTFHRGFLVPNCFIYLLGEIAYQKTFIKYLPNPFNRIPLLTEYIQPHKKHRAHDPSQVM